MAAAVNGSCAAATICDGSEASVLSFNCSMELSRDGDDDERLFDEDVDVFRAAVVAVAAPDTFVVLVLFTSFLSSSWFRCSSSIIFSFSVSSSLFSSLFFSSVTCVGFELIASLAVASTTSGALSARFPDSSSSIRFRVSALVVVVGCGGCKLFANLIMKSSFTSSLLAFIVVVVVDDEEDDNVDIFK